MIKKYFAIGYNCNNPAPCGVVNKGYNPIKVVAGTSIEQVRNTWAGRCGFKPDSENFIVNKA